MYRPKGKKKALDTFVYHLELCTFCNLCIEACPTSAIKMAQTFEHSVLDRAELTKVLNKPGSKIRKGRMTASQIIFYILSAFILGTAVLSVTTRKYSGLPFSCCFLLLAWRVCISGWKWSLSPRCRLWSMSGVSWCLLSFPCFSRSSQAEVMAKAPVVRKICSSAGSNFDSRLPICWFSKTGFEATGKPLTGA